MHVLLLFLLEAIDTQEYVFSSSVDSYVRIFVRV